MPMQESAVLNSKYEASRKLVAEAEMKLETMSTNSNRTITSSLHGSNTTGLSNASGSNDYSYVTNVMIEAGAKKLELLKEEVREFDKVHEELVLKHKCDLQRATALKV